MIIKFVRICHVDEPVPHFQSEATTADADGWSSSWCGSLSNWDFLRMKIFLLLENNLSSIDQVTLWTFESQEDWSECSQRLVYSNWCLKVHKSFPRIFLFNKTNAVSQTLFCPAPAWLLDRTNEIFSFDSRYYLSSILKCVFQYFELLPELPRTLNAIIR